VRGAAFVFIAVAVGAAVGAANAAVDGGNRPAACAPGYSPCLPVVADLDCDEIPESQKPVRVTGSDQYRLDADGDGFGCDQGGGSSSPSVSAGSGNISRRKAATLAFSTTEGAHYDARTPVKFIANPPSGLRAGSLVAAAATYRDYGAGRPSALVRLFVYGSRDAAVSALHSICPATACSRSSAAAKFGITLRSRAWPSPPGNCVRLSSHRDNIVVVVDTCAARDDDGDRYSVGKLKFDTAYLVGAVHARARRLF
jgi:hypothetical protein